MPGHTGREQLKIFPIRSRLAGFEQEEQAIQHLAAVLGEPVLRAPTPSMADGLLLCSGGVEEECVNLLRGGASRVMLAGPDHNAYAAGAEVAAWGQREGVPLRLQPLGQRNGVQVRYWLVAQRARNRLKEAVIGLLGGSASWLVASVPQEELLGERFGTGLTHLGWTELLEGIGDDFPFRKAAHADRWTALPRAETVVTQDMRRSLGFSAALEQLVRKRAFSAVALDCFQLVTRLHLTGCLALADLNEAGIPAACEG
ncbi:MAG: hypothetical protein FJ125_01810, partial [Deltaproteobacteria bacterium]|nr:hypothetical protein [Deltaproteobacteria bacterium]